MRQEHPGTGNSRWVDPFLGNEESALPEPEGVAATWWCAKPPVGNTHPGATRPFGMVSACAYSGAYVTGYGRYGVSLTGDRPPVAFPRHEALGIAHFQQSGTGRIRVYYNYLLTTPLVGEGLEGLGKRFGLVDEAAWPGYYAGRFDESGVDFEVTCTPRVAVHRYTFPPGGSGKVAIDFSAGGLLLEGMETRPSEARLEVTDGGALRGMIRMEGIPIHAWIEATSGCGVVGLWEDGRQLDGARHYSCQFDAPDSPSGFGAWFELAGGEAAIELRIGFSLRDSERARASVVESGGKDFPALVREGTDHWDEVLGRIEIAGGSEAQREMFYSALYHATLKPADFRDENPFTGEDGPFFFDLATLWDQYKTQLPLVMSLWPEWGSDFVAFLAEVARREGSFPISYLMDNAPERFAKQATGLCHMILWDAQMRGIEGDWDEILSLLWRTSLSGKGRGGRFAEYARHHVVHPLSHTLDLSFAHYCMAQMAKRVGDQRIYDHCLPLSRHWPAAFDERTGLLREDSDYYEGTHWNYSFRLLHDMAGRIKLAGGEPGFLERLDLFFGFRPPRHGEVVDRFEGLNNEPDMEAPYAYLFAGRPDRTALVVRRVLGSQFACGRGGLPGNDDSGGLSSWFVWSAVGIFPATGLPVMLIGSPLFERAVLRLPGGSFVVEARNQGEDCLFVQRAWLNGEELDRSYLRLDEFQGGGELVLEMGREPSGWAAGSRPPSFLG